MDMKSNLNWTNVGIFLIFGVLGAIAGWPFVSALMTNTWVYLESVFNQVTLFATIGVFIIVLIALRDKAIAAIAGLLVGVVVVGLLAWGIPGWAGFFGGLGLPAAIMVMGSGIKKIGVVITKVCLKIGLLKPVVM